MKKVYVSSTDGDFENLIFVWAENQKEAKEKIIEEMVKDDLFLDHLYDRTPDGIAGKLFRDEIGYFFNQCHNGYREDLKEKYITDDLIEGYMANKFKDNCVNFFKNEEWAYLYFDYFYDFDINDGDIEFPDEMLKFIARKEAKTWNGFNPTILKIID